MPEVKERPILFGAPMVRAILEGQKTVTRRVIKPQPVWDGKFFKWEGHAPNSKFGQVAGTLDAKLLMSSSSPYGKPGDRLWVRETFNTSSDCRPPIDEPFIYAADRNSDGFQRWAARWKPSIHMPRAASRILLEVTSIRVERLQDITEEQAIAEGVLSCERDIDENGNGYSPLELFGGLWTMINGMESWFANPWVWVVEFKRVMP